TQHKSGTITHRGSTDCPRSAQLLSLAHTGPLLQFPRDWKWLHAPQDIPPPFGIVSRPTSPRRRNSNFPLLRSPSPSLASSNLQYGVHIHHVQSQLYPSYAETSMLAQPAGLRSLSDKAWASPLLPWVRGPHNWHPLSDHSMSTVDASANANANTGKPTTTTAPTTLPHPHPRPGSLHASCYDGSTAN
ncbi:hypothetical protein JMJ77_0005231, partial [Colletotrichum scovillei]